MNPQQNNNTKNNSKNQKVSQSGSNVAQARGKNWKRNQKRKESQRALRQELVAPFAMVPNQTRSGKPNNPADPRSTRSLAQLGNTPDGRKWALQVLHPNGEKMSFVSKIPDGSASESVSMVRRDEYEFSFPSAFEVDTWDIYIIQTPFLFNSLVVLARIAGDKSPLTPSQVFEHLFREIGAGTLGVSYYPTWALPTSKGSDYDSYRYYVCQSATLDKAFNLANTDHDTANVFVDTRFRSVRRVACGLTLDFNANALTNKGTITSGQFPPSIAPRTVKTMTGAKGDTGDNIQVVGFVSDTYEIELPPLEHDDIIQSDSKFSTRLACDGDYSPQRMWQPTIEFTPCTDLRTVSFNSVDYGAEDFALSNLYNIQLKGWGSYVSHWRGMDKSSSIRVVRRETLEMVTGSQSDFSPFATPGYPEDQRAYAIVREFSRSSPHSYPADMNHKDGLLSGIIGGLGQALGNLGIPIVSDIAPALGGIISGLLPF